MRPKYEEDFYGWISASIALLKQKRFDEMDIDHLIEELEDMGNNKKHALVSRLAQLIFHLLKWQRQPDFRGRIWDASIQEQRKKIKKLLLENPSLKSEIDMFLADAYEDSILLIKKETPIDLKLLPQECPYRFDQIMNDEFYPE
jgi:hypothetical protein